MNRLRAHLALFAAPALALALSLSATSAHAEGAYVGLGGLVRHYDLSQPGLTGDAASGGGLSARFIAGYDFNDTWGLEGGYVTFGNPGHAVSDSTGAAGRLSTKGFSWFGAAKASLPLNEQFSLFGKLGLDRHHWEAVGSGSAASFSQRKSSNELYLGLGMQYRINKSLATTLEVERFGATRHPGGVSAGASLNLHYHF